MAYSAKNVKESLGQGEDMERDDERVETHISGVRNLSEEAREMRAAGRKLVGELARTRRRPMTSAITEGSPVP